MRGLVGRSAQTARFSARRRGRGGDLPAGAYRSDMGDAAVAAGRDADGGEAVEHG